MRDYLSLARQRVAEIIPHPTVVRTLIAKHRTYAYAIAAVFLFAIMYSLIAMRDMSIAGAEKDSGVIAAPLTQATTKQTKDDSQAQPVVQGETTMNAQQTTTGNSDSSSQSSANVTVNNQQIPVPENGSVSKTIQSGDGSTSVNVSSNNTSNGNADSNSSTSTSLNISTSTNSHKTTVNVNRSTTH